MKEEPLIFIVDDDEDVRDSTRALLASAGFCTAVYPSASMFLTNLSSHVGCLIVDIHMPEMSGLELLEEMKTRRIDLPIIVMTGHGDVPLAVRAMKAGALDFIEKPFDDKILLASIHRALEIGKGTRNRVIETRAAENLLALLTPREHEVLNQIVIGHSNKVAAFELGISPRTIEIHRAHIMDKINANSLSELVRIALAAGFPALTSSKAA